MSLLDISEDVQLACPLSSLLTEALGNKIIAYRAASRKATSPVDRMPR